MDVKKEILNFKQRAYKNICTSYHCKLFVANFIAKITHNDAYYRYNCYKNLRKYMSCNNLIKKLILYRKYSYFAHKINVQLVCDSIGENFYFEHGDIVINKNSIIGNNVRLIGNNCVGGGETGPLFL